MATRPLPEQVQVEVNEGGRTVLTIAGEPVIEGAHDDGELEGRVIAYPEDATMTKIVADLDRMITEAEVELAELEPRFKQIQGRLRTLRQMRRLARPDQAGQSLVEAKPKPKRKLPSEERIQQLYDAMPSDTRMIQIEVVRAAGIDRVSGTTRASFKAMRERGMIRMVGQRKLKRGSPKPEYVKVDGSPS